jgi:hemerythrin-like domain-containing protein
LADSDEGPAREKLTVEIDKALRLHMEVEENIIYPAVATEIGAEDEEEAEIEHGLAREGLAKLAELVAKPGFGAAVEMLKAGIGHHVKEEETELLPKLKSSLSREEWLALGDKIADAKAAAGAPVKAAPRRGTKKK